MLNCCSGYCSRIQRGQLRNYEAVSVLMIVLERPTPLHFARIEGHLRSSGSKDLRPPCIREQSDDEREQARKQHDHTDPQFNPLLRN